MEQFVKRHWFKVAAVAILLIVAGLVLLNSREKAEPLKNYGQGGYYTLDNILSNEKETLKDSNGKVRLMYFYYSQCPDVCLPTTYLMSQVQKKLKSKGYKEEDVRLISITFDPVRDTPERLKEFAAGYEADPKLWGFLRGEEQEIADLAVTYGISAVKDKNGDFLHQNIMQLIDREGNIRGYLNANNLELTADSIVEQMEQLLEE